MLVYMFNVKCIFFSCYVIICDYIFQQMDKINLNCFFLVYMNVYKFMLIDVNFKIWNFSFRIQIER